jgi:phosphatidylinositol kinase/protein kinase (PI-3  family)
MQILRDNRETLMTVLDAFIHDPLVEWEDERRRIVRPLARSAADTTSDRISLSRALTGAAWLPERGTAARHEAARTQRA